MSQTNSSFSIYIDEAGRGPLAGPVSVGAVLPLEGFSTQEFQDSKLLTSAQRTELAAKIDQLQQQGKLIASRGMATSQEIDTHGIIQALQLATCRAFFSLLKELYVTQRRAHLDTHPSAQEQLDILFSQKTVNAALIRQILAVDQPVVTIDKLMIDGNHTFGLHYHLPTPIQLIIKGDQKEPYISMASIVAKVERDQHMIKICEDLPVYNLSQHKGYATHKHRQTIKKHGLSVVHRETFCARITTTKVDGPDIDLTPRAWKPTSKMQNGELKAEE